MLKKYTESRMIPKQEIRYEETFLKDAIDETGKSVRVIDDGRRNIYTETQIDEQLAKWQGLKDKITALKVQN